MHLNQLKQVLRLLFKEKRIHASRFAGTNPVLALRYE